MNGRTLNEAEGRSFQSTQQKEYSWTGQGAIILCAIFWSTSGLFIKLSDWHPVAIAGGRSFLAACFLFFVRCLFRKPANSPPFSWKNNLPILILGGINYAFTMIIFVIANKMTTPANAILLQYTSPVWAAIFGWFILKEKLYWEHLAALLMAGIGMLLFFGNSLGKGSLLGDCLALVSGISFGLNAVILRKAKEQNPADILLLSNILVALFSVPYFFLFVPSLSALNIFSISFLGIFQIGAASALFAYGIKRISAVQAILTATFEPVLNPVWVFLVTGEGPSFSAILGGCIIITAILVSSLISRRRFNASVQVNKPV